MRKTLLALSLVFFLLLASSLVLWERHEATTCFNTPSCVLNNAGINEGIILMQHHENEWRIATYQNGTLTLHVLKLKGNIIPKVEHHEKSVKTYADYSPLSFEAKRVGNLKSVKEELLVKSNDTIRIFEGALKSIPCREFITLCPECKAALGDGWELVRLGHTNVTGGYLVFPSKGKCASSFVLKILPHNGTHDLIEIEYPIGTVYGYAPRLNLPQIERTNLPTNVSQYFDSAWGILVMNGEVVLNPDPWNIVDELGECRMVSQITIYSNGSVKRHDYGKPCWRR
ncbi:hypothetical protein [Thermococcus profundus]|nr:hypothetical protein [Thermococcus profundus]